MFEYKEIKARLEKLKCEDHARRAMVSFKDGKVVLEGVCCPKHKQYLLDTLADAEYEGDTEMLLHSVAGM